MAVCVTGHFLEGLLRTKSPKKMTDLEIHEELKHPLILTSLTVRHMESHDSKRMWIW